jgi:hypothetical protein
MKAIEVVARFSAEGEITPLQIIWNGVTLKLTTGRQWEDIDGRRHFLTMADNGQMFELEWIKEDNQWYLNETSQIQII